MSGQVSGPESTTPDELTIGVHRLPVWPKGQRVQNWQKSGILVTRFDDHDHYAPGLRDTALERAANPELAQQFDSNVGVGGAKAYDIEKWPDQTAAFINARAMAFFRHATRGAAPVVDLSWATIYHDGHFFMPHSHPRTYISVLYLLERGEDDDPMNGRFFFADPRLEPCCRQQKGYMTTPSAPDMKAGTMVLFPGQAVHFVTPYRGARPRVTMSWDLNTVAVKGSPLPDGVARPT